MTWHLLVGKGEAERCFARDGKMVFTYKCTDLDLSNFGPGWLDGEILRSEGL